MKNRSQTEAIFQDFDPSKQTWLVSDLRTKFELQEHILRKYNSFTDESVYRASDLWKLILRRAFPGIKVVSDPFVRSLIRTMLDENTEALDGLNASAEETIYAYIEQMASIVFHPEGTKNLEEWFEAHPESAQKWKKWYLAARWVVLKLLNEHRVVSQRWISAVLQSNLNMENFWQRDLIVDLSGELSRTEAELLRGLSRYCDVTVLVPEPTWKNDFYYLLQPYEYLKAEAQAKVSLSGDFSSPKSMAVHRFSGMLAEVKFAVGQVRTWLNDGVSIDSIVVSAPEIEVYWPTLRSYLYTEGIPVHKNLSAKLQSLPSVTKWMAQLRIRSGRLSATDLELSFYESDSAQKLRFEKFKALFSSLYVDRDLDRHQLLKEAFAGKFEASTVVSRDEFVAQSLVYWPGLDFEHLQLVLRELLANADETINLHWNEWLKYLESIVAVKEWTVEKGHEEGLTVTKLSSAGSSNYTHRIFLGLTDEQLKVKSKLQLDNTEYFELAKDLGFVLYNPDFSDLEFELKWLSENPSDHDIYCLGMADFSGKLQTPSKYWMELDLKNEQATGKIANAISIPQTLRWDEIQSQLSDLNERLLNDLKQQEQSSVLLERKVSLSPSGIKEFHKCPFAFAAGRVFRLEDHPDVDLDIDPRTKGNLAHYLFEKLGAEPIRFDWSDEEILQILEEGRKEKELVFAADDLWPPMRQRFLLIGKKFIAFEKELRRQFPRMKTLAIEKSVQVWFDLDNDKFSTVEVPNGVLLNGRIDRVDGDGNQMVVYDYKASTASAPSTTKWLDDYELQMPFYMWALEQLQEPPFTGSVDGALYYIYKDFDLKGFTVSERGGNLYAGLKSTARNKVQNSDEGKQQLMKSFEQMAAEKIKSVAQGLFQPKPHKESDCPQCKWRRLCRAPHLS